MHFTLFNRLSRSVFELRRSRKEIGEWVHPSFDCWASERASKFKKTKRRIGKEVDLPKWKGDEEGEFGFSLIEFT